MLKPISSSLILAANGVIFACEALEGLLTVAVVIR